MAQRQATLLVQGNVVKSERKRGTMVARDTGDNIEWDYIEARLLTPEFDTLDVRFPSDGAIPVPRRDELVTLRIEARVAGGNLRLSALDILALEDSPVAAVSGA